MALTSKITPYNADWPNQYRLEASQLTPVLGSALVDIHHVGSTAIPGLAAKPEIDVLAVVENIAHVEDWTNDLTLMGYRRGGDLSEGHLFFKRDADGVRTHKLHVCTTGHPKIGEMLGFRDLLRLNREVRDEYQALKIQLERDNIAGIAQYLEGKAPFILSVLKRIEST